MRLRKRIRYGLLVILLVGAIFSSGCSCNENPKLNVQLTPAGLELGHGQSASSQARIRIGNDDGPPAAWSIPRYDFSPNYQKALASWACNPTSDSITTTVTVTAQDQLAPDNSFFLGNANQFELRVGADVPFQPGLGNYASAKLLIVAYDLKMEEVHRSIKPTYGTRNGKQAVSSLEVDLVVEILFDPTPLPYTFEATGRLQRFVHTSKQLPDGSHAGGTHWAWLAGTPTITAKTGTGGKTGRIQATGDFSGIVEGEGETTTDVNVLLEVTARRSDGREVKGVFHFTKITNCRFC